jgi:CheY-like chemotaxis protein
MADSRIFLVEDEPAIRHVLVRLLRDWGTRWSR